MQYMHSAQYAYIKINKNLILGLVVQSVACPTADPGGESSIPARSYTFVEIDREIISTVILLLPLIQEGLLSTTSDIMCTNYWITA